MYMGFKKLKEKLSKTTKNPGAVAATVMRKKYKQKDISKHQQSGTSMEHVKPKKTYG